MSTILGALRYALCHDELQRRRDTEVGRAGSPLPAAVCSGFCGAATQCAPYKLKIFAQRRFPTRVFRFLCGQCFVFVRPFLLQHGFQWAI